MPITETLVCDCDNCNKRRAQRLREDLNAMADRRRVDDYNRFFDLPTSADMAMAATLASIKSTDIEFQDEWTPHWKPSRTVITMLIVLGAFALGLGYEGFRHALAWLHSMIG